MNKPLYIIAFLFVQSFAQSAIAEVDSARQKELLYFIKHD